MLITGFCVNDVFAEDEISLKLELNQNQYVITDSIILKITPERFVPNTGFEIETIGEDGFIHHQYIQANEISKDQEIRITLLTDVVWYAVEYHNATPTIQRIDAPSQKYTVNVYYGYESLNFGKNSITFDYNKNSSVVDFMIKNYAPDKLDLGIMANIQKPIIANLNCEKIGTCKITILSVYTSDGREIKPHGLMDEYDVDGRVTVSFYDDKKHAQEYYDNIKLTSDPDQSSIHENFHCTPSDVLLVCNYDNLLVEFKGRLVWSQEGSHESILKKISSIGLPPSDTQTIEDKHPSTSINTKSTKQVSLSDIEIASFVDQSKNPQHYIDRYNNEPKYKEWFDENYPQYISIYEAVGLPEPFLPMTNPTPIDPCTTSSGMSDASTYECQKANAYSKLYTNNKQPSGYLALQDQESKNQRSESMCARGMELVGDTCQLIETKIKESEGGGCLIATATYGSELAPQVQLLRELRDNQLLNTESGTSFMNTFNDFYYSFSPTIADYERENPYFKETVKIVITPMISSLSILNYVDIDSEVSVLGYGISLILLNVGMYFVAPVVVIHTIRKKF